MDEPPLHDCMPDDQWTDALGQRLPGIRPLDPAEWLVADEAFAGQMRLRDRLISERPTDVHALTEEGRPAAVECLEHVLDALACSQSYRIDGDRVARPDGVTVEIDTDAPLLTLGRLVQEDVCILENHGADEHVLTGAILCFPASWTLAEKIGQPLARIHVPVARYDAEVAKRVQRLFDAIRPGAPLRRANMLLYDRADLFSPRREGDPARDISGRGRFVRSERQTLTRLPYTRAVVFTIHTFLVPVSAVPPERSGELAILRRDFA